MSVTVEKLNKNYRDAKYAVRGEVPTLAGQIKEELKDPEKAKNYNFDKIISCNIGNPQRLGQKPLSFCREVTSLVLDPQLMEEHPDFFSAESIERAKNILKSDNDLATYGYTDVQGAKYIREQVATFIEERDGLEKGTINSDYIFLSDGASVAIKMVLAAISDPDRPENVGFMIPVPQYPLYSAAITCLGNKIVPYYLNEETSWSVDVKDLKKAYKKETSNGIDVRAVIIINPGNPTGSVLDEKCMMKIIEFCAKNKIVLLADEVYQINIYDKKKQFNSFQSIASKYIKAHPRSPVPRVVSFHSTSKGVIGECGQRGGYLSYTGFGECSDIFRELLRKISIPDVCPNIAGQCVLSTMIAPPAKDSEADNLDKKQQKDIFESLKRRANMATKAFDNKSIGLETQVVEGALYAFPQIKLPKNFINEALENGEEPDLAYAKRLVKETGLVVVPGSGFLQKKNTYHFRTSILPQEEDFKNFLDTLVKFQKKINEEYSKKETGRKRRATSTGKAGPTKKKSNNDN